ncbi:hypothetical protein [Tenacibaculum sp. M341]|uniref:hypothetical protein n=1 Tax=Tenacibaculum sp. M341 TaxID=2530339 RepID=UPI0014046E7F|nr:hypothetical protein [Tenacibaculum sp. M341]
MKKEEKSHSKKLFNRKEALQKIGVYGKYVAFTALSTYFILNPKEAQAASPETPGDGF